jgi:hypothetical protein
VAEEHLAGDFGVDAIGVIEKRRGEESEAGVKEKPESEENEAGAVALGGSDSHRDSVCASKVRARCRRLRLTDDA